MSKVIRVKSNKDESGKLIGFKVYERIGIVAYNEAAAMKIFGPPKGVLPVAEEEELPGNPWYEQKRSDLHS